MRSYEMTEIGVRGLEECLTEAFVTPTDDCDGIFLSVDIDVCDPGHAPGTGTPEPGGSVPRGDCSIRCAASPASFPVVGMDVVEVSPPYDHAEITSLLANRVLLEALTGIARPPAGRHRRHYLGPAPTPSRRSLAEVCNQDPRWAGRRV